MVVCTRFAGAAEVEAEVTDRTVVGADTVTDRRVDVIGLEVDDDDDGKDSEETDVFVVVGVDVTTDFSVVGAE